MTFYSILALSSFLLSLLGTRLIILAFRRRVVPLKPSVLMKNKALPAQKGGGIAVVMTLIICLMVADINYGMVLAIFLLASLSLLDDLIGIPFPIRLLVQILSVLIPLGVMHAPVFGGVFPLWMDRTIAAFLWVSFINIFTVMDRLDGISPIEMICIGIGFALIAVIGDTFPNPLSIYSLITMSAGAGFLWWNWHPARILLGEVGSVPIGFVLGYLLVLGIMSGYGFAAAILPAYYLSDALITFAYRIFKRKKIWVAHSDYYYLRAVRNGRKHSTVARYIFGVNILLILLANFSVINPDLAVFHMSIAYMAVFMILGFFAHTPHNPHYEPF